MVEDAVSRLPVDWQTLFKWLAIDAEKADIIYKDMMFSKYGCQPDWGDLLKSLVVEDPCIESQKLVFKPRFLLLNDHLQKQFLSFLMKYCDRIPDVYITPLLQMINYHVQPISEVYGLLLQLSAATKIEVSKVCAQDFGKETKDIALKESDEAKLGDKPGTSVIVIEDDDISQHPSKNDSKDPKQSSKRSRLESHETEYHAKRIKLDKTDANQHLEEHRVSENYSTDLNFECGNVDKIVDNEAINCVDGIEHAENEANIPEHVQSLGTRLKEIWINNSIDIPQSEFKKLTTFSVHELELVCQMIEFSSLTEDSICIVCEHLMSAWDSFSYTAGVCLLKKVLFYRIDNLTEKVSRQFSQTITTIARKSQKQFVDGVMIPEFKIAGEISSFKSEVFMSIIQESLSSGTRLYLLQQLLTSPLKLTESMVILIQGIIDNNCDFNEDVFQKLLENLLDGGSEFSKNLKFGKFLLSLTNKHGKDFKTLELLERIISFHSTFFKKTLLTAIKKIKS